MGKYFSNISWLTLEYMFSLLVGLFVSIYVARYLGPNDFGTLSYFYGLFAIISVIVNLGMHEILVREFATGNDKTEINGGELLSSALIFQLVIAVLTAIVCLIIYYFNFLEIDHSEMFLIMTFSLLFRPSGIFISYFQAQVKSQYFVKARLIVLCVSVLIQISIILNDADIRYFAYLYTLEALLLASLLYIYFRDNYGRVKPVWAVDKAIFLLKESWPLMIMSIAVIANTKIDQLMLKSYLGVYDVGIYSSSLRISEAWYALGALIVGTFFPLLSRLKNNHYDKYNTAIQLMLFGLFWLSVCWAGLVTVQAEWLIEMLYGVEYLEAYGVLIILSWNGVMVLCSVLIGRCYIIEGKMKWLLFRPIIAISINIALNALLIPGYGIYGAAMALLCSQVYVFVLHDLFDSDTRRMLWYKLNMINFRKNIEMFKQVFFKKS